MRWVIAALALLACACGRLSFDAIAPVGDAGGDAGDAVMSCVGSACNCVVEVAAGEQHACMRLRDGSVQCAGNNAFAQLGTGAVTPMELQPVVASVLGPIVQLAGGRDYTCARRANGIATCVGNNNDSQLTGAGGPTPSLTPLDPPAPPLLSIIAGNAFGCGITIGSDVVCWGDGDEGESGRGSSPDSHLPQLVLSLTGVTGLAGGTNHICAVHSSQVSCWGDGRLLRLGSVATETCPIASDGSIACSTTPLVNASIGNVAGVVTGHQHTCAWDASRKVFCWGGNDNGQLGRLDSLEETTAVVPGIADVTMLAAGRDHTCALKTDGSVWCWGDANAGQLGAASADSFTPVNVPMPAKATALVAHPMAFFTCAHLEDDSAYCWGSNAFGQLGRGTVEARAVPAPFPVTCPGS